MDDSTGAGGPVDAGRQDPLEQALVRQGWELVELMERIGGTETARLFGPRWEEARERGRSSYVPVPDSKGLTGRHRRMYESPANLTRFARTVDFIRPGEHVMEIGIGRGFLATMMLRDAGVGAYRGIELEQGNVDAARHMLQTNGFTDRATAEQGNLYALTRDVVAAHGTDLLICCEVLEHVPDPEAALRVLADSLAEGTDLLISVPLRGRLESVWGHIAMFGAARVRAMLAGAGLVVHHVEPLANTWVFVLCSRDPAGTGRSALVAATVPDLVADLEAPPEWPSRVDNVPVEPVGSRWNRRLKDHRVRPADREPGEAGAVLEATAGTDRPRLGRSKGHYAGLAFPCADVRGVRFEVDPIDVAGVTGYFANFYAGKQRVARWTWDPVRKPRAKRPTFLLQPHRTGTYFKRAQNGDLATADSFELFVQLEPGASVRLGVRRLGWIR